MIKISPNPRAYLSRSTVIPARFCYRPNIFDGLGEPFDLLIAMFDIVYAVNCTCMNTAHRSVQLGRHPAHAVADFSPPPLVRTCNVLSADIYR